MENKSHKNRSQAKTNSSSHSGRRHSGTMRSRTSRTRHVSSTSAQSARPHSPGASARRKPRTAHIGAGNGRVHSKNNRRGNRGHAHRDRRPSGGTDSHLIQRKTAVVPAIEKGKVRVIPLGGVEEVGKNMLIVETFDDIFIFDAGFQFVSEEEIPGIDYILPNIDYLVKNKKKIRGILVTHGHLDHIGGIPFMLEKLDYPPIYTGEITELLIRKRNEEFPNLKKVSYIPFKPNRRMQIGSSYIRSFPVTHSIPDSMGFVVETPQGDIVISGDLKLDHTAGVPSEREENTWGEFKGKNNLLFICDSTNAEQTGFSTDEHSVLKNMEELIKSAPNRIIIGTFASQFHRITKIIEYAAKYQRKVVVEGRSIKTNVEIAKRADRMDIPKGTIVSAQEAAKLPEKKVLVIATGAQGEEFAALMRMSTAQHKFIQLNDRDTIILSSSIIPGNEVSVQKLKDNLTRHGLRFFNYRTTDIHTSGHGNIEELIWMNQKVSAKYFMPAYGFHSMLRAHAQGVIDAGRDSKSVVLPDNGTVLEFDATGELKILKEKAPSSILAVDGLRIGEIQDVVIRDRKNLTTDGIFVVVISLDLNTGELKKSLDIISRGFVYLRDNQELMAGARKIIKKAVLDHTKGAHPINFDEVKKSVADSTATYLLKKTGKRPIVIPVVLGI